MKYDSAFVTCADIDKYLQHTPTFAKHMHGVQIFLCLLWLVFNPCFAWSSLDTESETYVRKHWWYRDITHAPNSAISKINLVGNKRHCDLYILRNEGFKNIQENMKWMSNPSSYKVTNFLELLLITYFFLSNHWACFLTFSTHHCLNPWCL